MLRMYHVLREANTFLFSGLVRGICGFRGDREPIASIEVGRTTSSDQEATATKNNSSAMLSFRLVVRCDRPSKR